MRLLSFLLASVLALLGYHERSLTQVVRASANGTDLIYSKTVLKQNDARFQCIHSETGTCHYAVFARQCASLVEQANPARCPTVMLQSFALAQGGEKKLPALPRDASACVDQNRVPQQPDCAR